MDQSRRPTTALLAALTLAVGLTAPSVQLPAVASGCAASAGDVAAVPATYGGVDADGNLRIGSAAHLLKLAATPADWDEDFVQTADIDLTGCTWRPIGTGPTIAGLLPFTGTYDGGGKEIVGVVVGNHPVETDPMDAAARAAGAGVPAGEQTRRLGLFGAIAGGAEIRDLTVRGLSVSGTNQIGGLVGTAQAGSGSWTVTGVTMIDITVTGETETGGLIGYAQDGAILNSRVVESSTGSSSVTGGPSAGGFGGLVGWMYSADLKFSSAFGTVTGAGAGGLVGELEEAMVESSFSRATVVGAEAGGLVGSEESGGMIRDSYAAGLTTGADAGGLIAVVDRVMIQRSYWDTVATGQATSAGGVAKDGTEMRDPATFVGWGIVEGWAAFDPDAGPVWGICEDVNDGYPYLLWQFDEDPCGGGVSATVSDAPTGVSGVAGDGRVTVSWTAPASDGGSAITGYTVTATPGGANCSPTGAATSCVVSGLTNGTAYTFTVVATNGVGSSVASAASAPVTPVAAAAGDPDDDSDDDSDAGAGSDDDSDAGSSSDTSWVPQDGAAPALAAGAAVRVLADGTVVELDVVATDDGRLTYATDGLTVTLTGEEGSSVEGGLLAAVDGTIECEVCTELVVAATMDAWLFSTPRQVGAHVVTAADCQVFTVSLASPLDGGGAVPLGAHTLQLTLPTSAGVEAFNVGLTVGGPVPSEVPSGEGGPGVPVPLGLLVLLGAVGVLVTSRRLVTAS